MYHKASTMQNARIATHAAPERALVCRFGEPCASGKAMLCAPAQHPAAESHGVTPLSKRIGGSTLAANEPQDIAFCNLAAQADGRSVCILCRRRQSAGHDAQLAGFFSILTPGPIVMRPGTLIDYRLRLRGFRIRWQSEITAWDPPHRLVDEQRRGPYTLWIHEHRFEARSGGTWVGDCVRYAVPGGKLIDRLFVRRDMERIFQFRREKLQSLFGKPS